MKESQTNQKKLNEALAYVKRIFNRNIYSESEIRRRLRLKGFEDVEDQVVDFMTELGMLNDEKFANFVANNLAEFKKYGPKKIRYTLINKGYDEDLTDNVVSNLEVNFLKIAKDVAYSFLKKRKFKNSYDKKHKLYLHLTYKGFTTQTIEEILREMKEENKI
jgi:regulatory protein